MFTVQDREHVRGRLLEKAHEVLVVALLALEIERHHHVRAASLREALTTIAESTAPQP